MASGLSSVVLLSFLCVVLCPCVSAGDDNCQSYKDLSNVYHQAKTCNYGFCCGSCFNRYCCNTSSLRFTEDQQENCGTTTPYCGSSLSRIFVIIISVSGLLIFICCCVCPCCHYKMCRKPRPTTTHTTVISSTPQHYPRQPTATPGQPMSCQYPPYRSTPMQSMPQGQPFVLGPPPTYQEATGPAYPPTMMPYSQAAFAPGQTPYPLQPPVQPNAPPPYTDYLAQLANNPDYVGQPPKTG